MRLVIPTTTLFTVAFLATLMSNTENAHIANAKLALGLTNDDLPPKKGSEDPESMEEPVTEVSLSAPENAHVMEFGTTLRNRNQDATEQRLAESNSRYMDTVRDIRLEGQSRSPVFIPEFSAASPWRNVAPEEIMNGEPFTDNASVRSNSPRGNVAPEKIMNGEPFIDNASVPSNSSLSRAMPAPRFPRTTATTRSRLTPPLNQGGTGSRRHAAPEIIDRSRVKAETVRPDNRSDRLPVPEPPSNFSSAIGFSGIGSRTASVPYTSTRVQPVAVRQEIPANNPNSVSPVARRGASSLPTFSFEESIAVPRDETTQSDLPIQGSAKDLLPLGEETSITPTNSPTAIVAAVPPPDPVSDLPKGGLGGDSEQTIGQTDNNTHNNIYRPNLQDVQFIQEQVQELQENAVVEDLIEGSPSLTIFNPTGYGADNNTGYVSATYQSRTRFVENDDGAVAIGFGFGDAQDAVGVEVSYTVASVFGENRDAGTGGFNLKVHRQFADDWAVAAGWNGVVFLGEDDGFEDSIYGTVTKVIRTQESITSPFSRVALTAGVGNGQFRSEESLENDDDGVNVFGSVAVRVAKPVSVVAEWTGQDLAVGASIAPFKKIPFVITPAVRDITGAGDGARFVLGAGVGFRF